MHEPEFCISNRERSTVLRKKGVPSPDAALIAKHVS